MRYAVIVVLIGTLLISCSNPMNPAWDLIIYGENEDAENLEVYAVVNGTTIDDDRIVNRSSEIEIESIRGVPDYSGEYMSNPIIVKKIFGAILSISDKYSEVDIYADVNASRFEGKVENNPQRILVGRNYKSDFRLNTNSFRHFLFIKSDEQLDIWLGEDANYPKISTKDNGDGWQYIVISDLPQFITIEGRASYEVGVDLHFNEGKGGKDAFIVE